MRLLPLLCLSFSLFACRSYPSETNSPSNSSLSLTSGERVTFQNPIAESGADPWVIFKNGYYYLIKSDSGSKLFIQRSKTLQDVGRAEERLVWQGQDGTLFATGYWAPELHFLKGKWYIYVSASDGPSDNHRMFALEGKSDDPLDGFVMKGQLRPPSDRWAIDGTVLEYKDKLYFIWSGWSLFQNIQQNLYIAPMDTPWSMHAEDPLVQHIEAEDSRVSGKDDQENNAFDFQIDVPSDGIYSIDFAYANGSDGDATTQISQYKLEVNSIPTRTLLFPFTGWDNYQTITQKYSLKAGRNSLRVLKDQNYADPDYIEVKRPDIDRVMISSPTEFWEVLGANPAVNEGPQVLKHGDKVHIIYSASASWTNFYNLGQLTLVGNDPMDPAAWEEVGSVFSSSGEVYAPGHASFTTSPNGQEDWIVYHAAKQKGSGWDRDIRIQKFTWTADGSPDFGKPLPLSTVIDAPAQ